MDGAWEEGRCEGIRVGIELGLKEAAMDHEKELEKERVWGYDVGFALACEIERSRRSTEAHPPSARSLRSSTASTATQTISTARDFVRSANLPSPSSTVDPAPFPSATAKTDSPISLDLSTPSSCPENDASVRAYHGRKSILRAASEGVDKVRTPDCFPIPSRNPPAQPHEIPRPHSKPLHIGIDERLVATVFSPASLPLCHAADLLLDDGAGASPGHGRGSGDGWLSKMLRGSLWRCDFLAHGRRLSPGNRPPSARYQQRAMREFIQFSFVYIPSGVGGGYKENVDPQPPATERRRWEWVTRQGRKSVFLGVGKSSRGWLRLANIGASSWRWCLNSAGAGGERRRALRDESYAGARVAFSGWAEDHERCSSMTMDNQLVAPKPTKTSQADNGEGRGGGRGRGRSGRGRGGRVSGR
ncbi:hypothetical protein R3P38DRAFT_2816067 [Favolaschia claudopus]|uniref:Uncharacterized protein n=1 Tax=Favolaschia claudopus TaxID=2862362 RepID=A0AAV9YZS0_9AGAR